MINIQQGWHIKSAKENKFHAIRRFLSLCSETLIHRLSVTLGQRSESFSAGQTGVAAHTPKIWQRHGLSVKECLLFTAL